METTFAKPDKTNVYIISIFVLIVVVLLVITLFKVNKVNKRLRTQQDNDEDILEISQKVNELHKSVFGDEAEKQAKANGE